MDGNAGAAQMPSVAAVIIGRNEGERLRACLKSVLSMDYPQDLVEVIYVDSSSTDSSVALAQSLGVKTVLLDGPTTAARGRNAGWTATEAPYILFLDGDTVLDPGFVAKAIAHFDDPTIAGVYGNRRETRTEESIYNAIFDLDWNAAPGWSLFFGGDTLVRREALVAVKGYNNLLIAGEEPDMCRRIRGLGYRILHLDEPMTRHDLAMHRFGQYWKRSIRTGYAFAEVSSMYAKTDDPLWSAESRSNVTRGLFWIAGPILALALSLLLWSLIPLGMFALAALALVGRTAAKAKWRTSDLKLLLIYSLHSHLQQVPIFLGQMRYKTRRLRGQGSAIIEYKTVPYRSKPEGSGTMFEDFKEDWATYDGDLTRRGLWTMAVYRFGRWRYTIKSGLVRKPFSLLYKLLKVVSEIVTHVELPCEAVVGRRLIIEHAFDVVISGDAVLGDDVVLRNGVTIGLRHRLIRGSPVIGNRCDIGTGAKILGPITIGDDVAIGANAVVITDVPSNSIAVGVPAKIKLRKSESSAPHVLETPPEPATQAESQLAPR